VEIAAVVRKISRESPQRNFIIEKKANENE